MEKYILSLIKENNRVIIPNFGAFIVAKENGYTILFNNFLSFNDGLLIDYVASIKNISKDEADKEVEVYVERVKKELDEKGEFKIEGLGKFTKDATGILRFEQADEINYHDEVENDLLDLDNSVKEDAEEGIASQPEIEVSEVSKVNEEPLVEVVEEETDKPVKEEKATPGITNRYIIADNKRRNQSIFLFLIVFVLIPIIGVIFYFSFFKNEMESVPVVNETESKPVIKDSIADDTLKMKVKPQGDVVASPEVKKEEKKVVIKPVVINHPHHIIAGSFKDIENARRYLKSLESRGLKECSVIKHKSMTMVSVGSFEKLYQAQKRQEEILDKYRIESWILTKKKQ